MEFLELKLKIIVAGFNSELDIPEKVIIEPMGKEEYMLIIIHWQKVTEKME
jgi:hypothetical protein